MAYDQKLEHLIKRCAEARRLFEHSEVDYYEFLFAVLTGERDTWAVLGTFETFIAQCVGRPNPARWTRYVVARERIGIDAIRRVGIPSALDSIKIEDNRKRVAYLEEQAEWSRQHDGVHASEQYAKQARERIDPKPERAIPSVHRLHELQDLRAENAALRSENARLKRDNDKLRERISKLGDAAVPAKGRARKPVAKGAESQAT